MRGSVLSFVTLCASLTPIGCATSPDILELASRPCPPLPPYGQGSFASVRVTFSSVGPVHAVVVQLLSLGERCVHHVPLMPDGTRELVSVPPGEYILHTVGPGTSMIEPIRFSLPDNISAAFTLPVVVENRVALCARSRICSAVLTKRASAELRSSEESRLRLLGYRLGIAMAIEAEPSLTGWVACVDVEDELVSQLREVYDRVAPRSECAREPGSDRLLHVPSRRLARAIEYEFHSHIPVLAANVLVGYVGPGTGGRTHRCLLQRSEEGWTAQHCEGSDQSWPPRGTPAPPPPPGL